MAFADLADYIARLKARSEVVPVNKVAVATIAGRLSSSWAAATLAGAAPTTAAVPARNITGAIGQQNAGTEALTLVGGQLSATAPGIFMLCDRLSHQGGLSGTVTGTVTTNLPTAALTRYTSGVGVMAAIDIYTQIGTTLTTISCTYNDETGTSSTSPLVAIGGTGFREAGRSFLIPLATGDLGFQSITASTLTATTATAGAFGYTLFKPLCGFVVDKIGPVYFDLMSGGMIGGLPEILDDACLEWRFIPTAAATAFSGAFNLTAV